MDDVRGFPAESMEGITMFDQLTPEENDTLRGMMLDAVTKTAKLASFAVSDHYLWTLASGVQVDCCQAIYDLADAL